MGPNGGKLVARMQFCSRGAWPWIIPVACALVLATPSVTLPGDDRGLRGFVTPPLGPDVKLGQTFTMTADGLRGIEVFPVAVDGTSSGEVRFELYELYDAGDDSRVILVRSAEVPVRDLLRSPSFTFSFEPIVASRNGMYRLDFVPVAAEGIAFWATKGARYEEGHMEINGVTRWADLAFRADAPVPSIWALLMTLRETHAARAYVVLVAFPAILLLVGLVIRRLAVSPSSVARRNADDASVEKIARGPDDELS